MRVFVAIELSDGMRGHLVGVQDRLRELVPSVSWTRAENLHLTLKFLGEVGDDVVKGVCDALGAMERIGELELKAGGIECFPDQGRIRIIGAGMECAGPGLMRLHEEIESACEREGFAREGRMFRPHVTLARARRPLAGALRGELKRAAAGESCGVKMEVGQFTLMESRLNDRGAEYRPLGRFYINMLN